MLTAQAVLSQQLAALGTVQYGQVSLVITLSCIGILGTSLFTPLQSMLQVVEVMVPHMKCVLSCQMDNRLDSQIL